MGVKKVNTSAYHPQSDGLVERFNRTLTDMLAKSTSPGGSEWDERLPYVLFSYRASLQMLTGRSPFFSYMAEILSCLQRPPSRHQLIAV